MGSIPYSDKDGAGTHGNQGGAQTLIVLLRVSGIVLRCLSFVRGVEIKFRVVALIDWKHIRGYLESACWFLQSVLHP